MCWMYRGLPRLLNWVFILLVNMQTISKHDLFHRRMRRDTVSCITVYLLLLFVLYTITAYLNGSLIPIISVCVCVVRRSFWSLFCVLIYSIDLRWWKIHLNSRIFCITVIWNIDHIYAWKILQLKYIFTTWTAEFLITGFLNLPNPSIRTMALGSTQLLIEMSTRNPPRGKGQLACEAASLTAISEPTV
jgi:hypothetical protein